MESFSVADDDGPAFQVQVLEDPDAGSHRFMTVAADDRSSYQLLVVVEDADAPNEYRFEGAVPAGHTAELLSDGSVAFYGSDGAEAGGIVAPWALDANGSDVATAYSLDGDTLIQTISHEGAAYPVIADPDWLDYARRVASAALGGGAAHVCRTVGATGPVATVVCGVVTTFVSDLSSDWVSRNFNRPSPEQDRTKGCRNPRECFA